jgi:hypothetical protein
MEKDKAFTPAIPSLPGKHQPRNEEIKAVNALLVNSPSGGHTIAGVHGLPGSGKSTFLAELAHSEEIKKRFAGKILWVSLGQQPDITARLRLCAKQIGFVDEDLTGLDDEAIARLIHGNLNDKKALILIDDVWEEAHATPFLLDGKDCATVVSSRSSSVAKLIAAPSEAVYHLGDMSLADSMALLKKLAPNVIAKYPNECGQLFERYGRLPMIIQVMGRLMNAKAILGLDPIDEIREIWESEYLFRANPPNEMGLGEKAKDVYMLFEKSLGLVEKEWRPFYGMLSVFGGKPIDYNLNAIKAVWDVEDPKPIVGKLVELGLLELVDGEVPRYQLHALLVEHASHLPEWTTEEKEETLRPAYIRHADHYRNALSDLDALYLKAPIP